MKQLLYLGEGTKVSLLQKKVRVRIMTDYPSIEKPWLKFYSQEAIDSNLPKMKMYDYIKAFSEGYERNNCLEFFGKKITYGELIKNVEKVTKGFISLGVKEGDIVSIVAPTMPEAIYCVYALNRVGAIANLIDPRLSKENIKEKIECSKYVVALDLVREKIDGAISDAKKIIYVSLIESFPWYAKIMFHLKHKQGKVLKGGNALDWVEFIHSGMQTSEVEDSLYHQNRVAILISTSGTTGKSKLAQLTNENVNAVAWQYEYAGYGKHYGETFLNIMPIFLAYGFISGIHMPLSLGFKIVIIPQRDLTQMAKYILKYKPQAYLDVPNGIASVISDKRMCGKDISYIQHIGVGGDTLDISLEQQCNEFLKDHGYSGKLQKGYGMTETGSAAIINVSDECNTLGSVGIPFVKTVAKIVDPETQEELGYNEIGELCLAGPGIFVGYLNDENATNAEIKVDEKGVHWIYTGDLFSMNENGELFFKERMKAMFVRPDGHNNHPHIMNELISKHPAVKAVCTVGVQSPYHAMGKYPKAVIMIKEEFKGKEDEVQQELEELCMKTFSQRDIPYYYEFLEEFPYTPNGKVDYKALENEGVGNSKVAEGVIF